MPSSDTTRSSVLEATGVAGAPAWRSRSAPAVDYAESNAATAAVQTASPATINVTRIAVLSMNLFHSDPIFFSPLFFFLGSATSAKTRPSAPPSCSARALSALASQFTQFPYSLHLTGRLGDCYQPAEIYYADVDEKVPWRKTSPQRIQRYTKENRGIFLCSLVTFVGEFFYSGSAKSRSSG